jgi:hypothetical protein
MMAPFGGIASTKNHRKECYGESRGKSIAGMEFRISTRNNLDLRSRRGFFGDIPFNRTHGRFLTGVSVQGLERLLC